MQGGLIFQKVNYILKKRVFKNCWAIVNAFEQLSMFVALKLEEASDREIADYLNINISAIPKMIFQLQKCA